MGDCRLTAALLQSLPGAVLLDRKQRAWHSATFAGEQVTLRLLLTGEDGKARAEAFAALLPDAEFDLGQQMVADIVVTAIEPGGPDGIGLTVEALLLDE